MPGPLHGVRILEVSNILLGPLACEILGDMGADVIKVEAPGGDGLRTIGMNRAHANMGAMFLTVNRNKRSVILDLKQPGARDALMKLAATCDVVLHNNRPQAMRKLKLEYADFKQVKPDIIYCAAHGYGKNGPYGERGALDDAIQAMAGITMLSEPALGEPRCMPAAVSDKTCGITVVYAVLGALFHRERTGEGQELEVPMFETMVHYTMVDHLWGGTFQPGIGGPGYPAMTSKNRKPCATKDGYLMIISYLEGHWETFCERTGRLDLMTDPRFSTLKTRIQNMDDTYGEVAKTMLTRTTDEWFEMFKDTSVPVTRVNTLQDVVEDPHLAAVGFWKTVEHPTEGTLRMASLPVNYSATPFEIRCAAPNLGEHSLEILKEAGLSQGEIDALLKTGATAEAA